MLFFFLGEEVAARVAERGNDESERTEKKRRQMKGKRLNTEKEEKDMCVY